MGHDSEVPLGGGLAIGKLGHPYHHPKLVQPMIHLDRVDIICDVTLDDRAGAGGNPMAEVARSWRDEHGGSEAA